MRQVRTVVLDPGHGGRDPGALGAYGLREKDVTLRLARALRPRLVARGFRVVMTRDGDRDSLPGGTHRLRRGRGWRRLHLSSHQRVEESQRPGNRNLLPRQEPRASLAARSGTGERRTRPSPRRSSTHRRPAPGIRGVGALGATGENSPPRSHRGRPFDPRIRRGSGREARPVLRPLPLQHALDPRWRRDS